MVFSAQTRFEYFYNNPLLQAFLLFLARGHCGHCVKTGAGHEPHSIRRDFWEENHRIHGNIDTNSSAIPQPLRIPPDRSLNFGGRISYDCDNWRRFGKSRKLNFDTVSRIRLTTNEYTFALLAPLITFPESTRSEGSRSKKFWKCWNSSVREEIVFTVLDDRLSQAPPSSNATIRSKLENPTSTG